VKRIAIVGSTGSIGQSALAVVDAHGDRLQVVAMAAGENVDRFAGQLSRTMVYRSARPWLLRDVRA
jgi:1-deoxy-D-xylulose-5-phosphate reductoisomerase